MRVLNDWLIDWYSTCGENFSPMIDVDRTYGSTREPGDLFFHRTKSNAVMTDGPMEADVDNVVIEWSGGVQVLSPHDDKPVVERYASNLIWPGSSLPHLCVYLAGMSSDSNPTEDDNENDRNMYFSSSHRYNWLKKKKKLVIPFPNSRLTRPFERSSHLI